jgi:hypothetical protein
MGEMDLTTAGQCNRQRGFGPFAVCAHASSEVQEVASGTTVSNCCIVRRTSSQWWKRG